MESNLCPFPGCKKHVSTGFCKEHHRVVYVIAECVYLESKKRRWHVGMGSVFRDLSDPEVLSVFFSRDGTPGQFREQITITELRSLLGVSKSTIFLWARNKVFPTQKVGRSTYIPALSVFLLVVAKKEVITTREAAELLGETNRYFRHLVDKHEILFHRSPIPTSATNKACFWRDELPGLKAQVKRVKFKRAKRGHCLGRQMEDAMSKSKDRVRREKKKPKAMQKPKTDVPPPLTKRR